MKKTSAIRSVILAAILLAYGAGASAQAVNEVEPNYPITAAQPLVFDVTGTAIVNAFLGNGDADIFSFWAKEGDVITVDIDGGYKGGGPGSVDTFVSVHQTASLNYLVMRGVDDAAELDPGSLGTEDSYIANLRIPADGVYYVSVAGYPNRVADGGVLSGGPGNTTGTYTLIVTGVSPAPVAPAPAPAPEPVASAPAPAPDPVIQAPAPEPVVSVPQPEVPVTLPPALLMKQVSIDIKPGQRGIARINPKSKHEIPVAILSANDFDVRNVDVNSLTFGRTGDEPSLDKCHKRTVHVNRDRQRDLVCKFENHLAGFEATDEEGVLKGRLMDGTPFEGRGMLKVISEKRRSHQAHGGDRRDNRDDRKRR